MRKSRNFLQVSGFLFTFALAKLKIVICLRAVQDAQSRNSGHFYCLILLRTNDPRLTISGGTPVEVTFSSEFYEVWRQGGCRFPVYIGVRDGVRRKATQGLKSVGILNPIGEMTVVVMQQMCRKRRTSPL